jgi:hypothetical protein
MSKIKTHMEMIEKHTDVVNEVLSQHHYICLFGRGRAKCSMGQITLGEDYYELPDLIDRLGKVAADFGYTLVPKEEDGQ